jgi:hypothetical protein
MEELAPLPKVRINSKVKYKGATATVVGCWWDDNEWRYELYISRGKNKGYWCATEGGITDGMA